MISTLAKIVSPHYQHETVCEIKLDGINKNLHIDTVVINIIPKLCVEYFYIIGVENTNKYQIGKCPNLEQQMKISNDGCPLDIYWKFYCPSNVFTTDLIEKYKHKNQKGQWYSIEEKDINNLILSIISFTNNNLQHNLNSLVGTGLKSDGENVINNLHSDVKSLENYNNGSDYKDNDCLFNNIMENFSDKCMFCSIISGLCRNKKFECIKTMYDQYGFKCRSYSLDSIPCNVKIYGQCYEGIEYCCIAEAVDIISYVTKKHKNVMAYVQKYTVRSQNVNLLPIVSSPQDITSISLLFPTHTVTVDYLNTLLDIYNRENIIKEIKNSYGKSGLNPTIDGLVNLYRMIGYQTAPYPSGSKQSKIDFLVLNISDQISDQPICRKNIKICN